MNTRMPDRPALVIFAGAPAAGRVNTRPAPDLSPAQAEDLYWAFLLDVLVQYAGLGAALRLYAAPPQEMIPANAVSSGVSVHSLQGSNPGAGMQRAFIETFAAGYGRVVAVWTGYPSLPPDFVSLAFEALEAPLSICIGPSDAGGCYLLGMNDLYPGLFEDVSYNSPDAFAGAMEQIEQTRASVSVLPTWYSVDMTADLDRLAADLRDAGIEAPNTRAVLSKFGYPAIRESTQP